MMWYQLIGVPLVSALIILCIGYFFGDRLGVSRRQTTLIASGVALGMSIGYGVINLMFW